LTKCVGSIYAYVKQAKTGKVMMRKGGDKQKESKIIDNEKQDPFQFVSV